MVKDKPIFSYLSGYYFTFDYKGEEIIAWYSCLTGLERVYVNGEAISQSRSFQIKRETNFQLDGINYAVLMAPVGAFEGPYKCELFVNGQLKQRKHLLLSSDKSSFFKKISLIWKLAFFYMAILIASLLFLPITRSNFEALMISLGLSCLAYFIWHAYKNRFTPRILIDFDSEATLESAGINKPVPAASISHIKRQGY